MRQLTRRLRYAKSIKKTLNLKGSEEFVRELTSTSILS